MAGSRIPGCPGSDLMWTAPRTPGPLGFNDHADPDVCTLLGDTPGPLGFGDHADPTLPSWCARGRELAQVVRLDDGTPLAVPVHATAAPGGRAPWMAIAEAQASKFKGAKEGDIEKTINFQIAVHTGQKTMVGRDHAWCAAFVNWCLSEAGIAIDNETFADHVAAKGRAHGFYMVARDRAKKGQPIPPEVRNPLYVDLPTPVFGAIAMQTNPGGHGHHVGFVYSRPSTNEVVLLGGNQSDTIKFSTFNIASVAARTETVQGKKVTIRGQPDHLKFFMPASYGAVARADLTPLGTDSAETLNERFGITQPKARPGVRESTR